MPISSGLVRAPGTHVLVPDSQPQPATWEQSRPQVKAPQFGPLCGAVGAEVIAPGLLQTPIDISVPVVRPPETQASCFLLHPHVVSVAQSRPHVNREQPTTIVGEGVGAELSTEPVQVPVVISESVVRPPATQASRFLLQPQKGARVAQSRPHSATAQPAVGEGEGKDVVGIGVGVGVGTGVGSDVVGSVVVGIEVGIGLGPDVVGLDMVGSDMVGSDVVGIVLGIGLGSSVVWVRLGVGVGSEVGDRVGENV